MCVYTPKVKLNGNVYLATEHTIVILNRISNDWQNNNNCLPMCQFIFSLYLSRLADDKTHPAGTNDYVFFLVNN